MSAYTDRFAAGQSLIAYQRTRKAAARLEYLRGQLRAECISYGELADLQGLAAYIEAGDTELLEAAGVPEFTPDPALCPRCRVPGHDTCGMVLDCPCCQDTFAQLADGA